MTLPHPVKSASISRQTMCKITNYNYYASNSRKIMCMTRSNGSLCSLTPSPRLNHIPITTNKMNKAFRPAITGSFAGIDEYSDVESWRLSLSCHLFVCISSVYFSRDLSLFVRVVAALGKNTLRLCCFPLRFLRCVHLVLEIGARACVRGRARASESARERAHENERERERKRVRGHACWEKESAHVFACGAHARKRAGRDCERWRAREERER